MIRYALAASMLKAFSLSPVTMRLYRALGNVIGARKRANGHMPGYYFERVSRILRLHQRYGLLQNGHRILELGTGWLHWEALTARLFFDVEAVLFDVWDNRQLAGLKNYVCQLDGLLHTLNVDQGMIQRAHHLIARIRKVNHFTELYKLLGFTYVIEPSGSLGHLERASFDLVVSAGVLEHIPKASCSELVRDLAVILKPGGYSCHSIQIGDHLYAYDQSVSPKEYLRYSDRTWTRWFENSVQYINRLQRADWLCLFETAGLTLVDEEIATEDISRLDVAKAYRHYSEVDLQCTNLKLLHRRP